MTQVTVDNPTMVAQKEVKDDGRIYVGTDMAGKNVEVVIAESDDAAEDSAEVVITESDDAAEDSAVNAGTHE